MPSKDWLDKNPKVSAHISYELYEKLQEFMEQQGIQSNAEALKVILNKYLNSKVDHSKENSSPPVDHSVDQRLTTLESQIKKLSQQVIDLAKPLGEDHSSPLVDHSKSNSSPLVVNSSPLPNAEGWLTTGEAYTELQKRGYEKSQGTFRRTLKQGKVTIELEKLGLIANFEVRNQANPKDNSVRWLMVKQYKN